VHRLKQHGNPWRLSEIYRRLEKDTQRNKRLPMSSIDPGQWEIGVQALIELYILGTEKWVVQKRTCNGQKAAPNF
jgi:hypothetical protein